MYGRPNWRWPGRIRTSHGRVIRIITYNVLGLQGYPPGDALEALGSFGGDAHIDHFAGVFMQLNADILALEEGVAALMIKTIAQRLE